MTTAVTITKYKCAICGAMYDTFTAAESCESRPVRQDKGVKIGDRVRVTAGDGVGRLGPVEAVIIFDKEWGHYAWERYWHTVGVTAALDEGFHRLLTFDSYEKL